MRVMRWPRILALACAVALLGAVALPPSASAHLVSRPALVPALVEDVAPVAAPSVTFPSPALSWTAAPTPVSVPWHLLALLGGLAALGARRPRRALGLALILLLAVFAFESGVHSVHHLADPARGEHCALAAASQHVSGTEVSAVIAAESLPQTPHEPALGAPAARVRLIGPEQGRAPPILPA
jgi:hypothetical protein